MQWQTVVERVGECIDVIGVSIMVIGLAISMGSYVKRYLTGDRSLSSYRSVRASTGRSILLGLEFLVAGDIIRTVATEPTFSEVGVLAVIVAIRTFLSMTLELEVSGRWPWQTRSTESEALSQ